MRQSMALLEKNHNDYLALFLIGSIYALAEKFAMAVTCFLRVVDLKPKSEAWSNLGMSYQGLHLTGKAMECFQTAWKQERKAAYAANIASIHLDRQEYRKAIEWADRSLELEPELNGARASRGMATLALGDFSGWKDYGYSLGGKFRKETQFKDEGKWDGTPGKTLVVYGEQGLGDEIMYASCVPDAAKDCTVILECDPRLEGLFKRSFPQVTVYGTRRLAADWPEKHDIDARCAIAGLPEFYRTKREDFPRKPYLTADPDRRLAWRGLLNSFGKRKIGLCWTGGSRHNNPESRAIGLEAFRPLIEAVDATFVSLQYKDASEEINASGLPVKHWQWMNTQDYDDTAALVAELDLVIGVHTSVHHVAGALGVPQIILVPDKTLWLYAHDEFPWYPAKLVRQRGDWAKTIQGLINDSSICGV